MNDYYATLRIQQGRMKAAMQELGIPTQSELAKRSGVSMEAVSKLLNFKRSPKTKDGKWSGSALAIAKTLGAEPDDIFPEHLWHEIPTNRIAAFVEHAQLGGETVRQLGPAEEAEREDLEQTLDEVLGTLTERERTLLKARFWDNATLKEAGERIGVSGSRAMQMEECALRKLRHPTRAKRLSEVCEFDARVDTRDASS